MEIGARFDFSQCSDGQFMNGGYGFIEGLLGKVGERVQALFKFTSGLVGEGYDFHIMRRYSQFKEGGDASGDHLGFAGAGACDDKASFIWGEGGLALVGVKLDFFWEKEGFKGFVLLFF